MLELFFGLTTNQCGGFLFLKLAPNVLRLGGRFNAAKPLLYEVPTYLAENLN